MLIRIAISVKFQILESLTSHQRSEPLSGSTTHPGELIRRRTGLEASPGSPPKEKRRVRELFRAN